MVRRVIQVSILVVLLLLLAQPAPSLSSSSEPKQIRVYVCPPKLPADNKTYEAVFIQLLSAAGLPARAPRDIEVSLSSSNVGIVKVEGRVLVKAGETYAVAKATTTYTAGSAIITAAAPGIGSASATATTVGSAPARVAVYALPPTLPADGRRHMALIVQLLDSGGNPTRAPAGGLRVELYSSNSSICAVDPYIIIGEGENYAVAALTPSIAGSVTITPVAHGLTPIDTSVRVQEPAGKPVKIKVYASPSRLLADGRMHRAVAVQLLDAYGRIARAEVDLNVTLSSSNVDVGAVDKAVVIKAGETYSSAGFYASFSQGSTTITAVAPDLQKDQASISTVGFLPNRIFAYCAFPLIPADGRKHRVLVLQLQDQRGLPAAGLKGIEVTLTSSNEQIVLLNRTVLISAGTSSILVEVKSSHIAGSAFITAQSAGLSSSQVQVTTRLIDSFALKVSVTAHPGSVKPRETVRIRVYVTVEGATPAVGAAVKVRSDAKVSFAKIVEEGGGFYATSFTAPDVSAPTTIKVTVEASLTGYVSGSGSTEVKVEPLIKLGGVKIFVSGEDGKPIQGARVTATSGPSGAPQLITVTGEDGIAQFIGIPEGQYTFEVGREGYVSQTVAVNVKADQTINVTVTLTVERGFHQWIIAAAIVSAAAAAIIFVLRRKGIQLFKRRAEQPAKPQETKKPTDLGKEQTQARGGG